MNNQIRYRMKPIQKIKIREERFATPDNTSLMARARFKQAVIKILTKIQAYHIFEKIKRNKHCIIQVHSFVKNYHHMPATQPNPQNAISARDGQSADRNFGFGSQVGKGVLTGHEGAGSGDSEDVFEDEEISSSECNSEDSAYSQAEHGDILSQGDSKELKINQLNGNATPLKLPENSGDKQ